MLPLAAASAALRGVSGVVDRDELMLKVAFEEMEGFLP